MLCAISPAANGGETASFVAVVIELQHLNRHTNDSGFAGHLYAVLESWSEGPKLLVFPMKTPSSGPNRLT